MAPWRGRSRPAPLRRRRRAAQGDESSSPASAHRCEQAIEIKRNTDDQVDAISADGHRQVARQERRRRAAASARRQHHLGGERRRRLRRERPRQHPRHLAQPDPGHGRRPLGRDRRLVHPRPVLDCRPQRQLHPAAVRNRQRRRWSTRPRTPRCWKAASPARSTSSPAARWTSPTPSPSRRSVQGAYNTLTKQTEAAGQRPDRLAQRRRHLRRHASRASTRTAALRRYGQETLGYTADHRGHATGAAIPALIGVRRRP